MTYLDALYLLHNGETTNYAVYKYVDRDILNKYVTEQRITTTETVKIHPSPSRLTMVKTHLNRTICWSYPRK